MWFPLKDRALAGTVRLILNHKFKSFGKVTTLHLDTQAHLIELSVELAGETQPIAAKIAYRLEEQDGVTSLVPTKVECSRPWIELLAAQMLSDGALKIPVPQGMAATVVKMLGV